jgi:hypothetical protein
LDGFASRIKIKFQITNSKPSSLKIVSSSERNLEVMDFEKIHYLIMKFFIIEKKGQDTSGTFVMPKIVHNLWQPSPLSSPRHKDWRGEPAILLGG